MPGLTSTFEIARTTLQNQQLMIQIATNNIANADNKSYARQKVSLVSNPPSRIAAGWIGNGARIEGITQVRDQYVDKQLLASVSQESDYRTRSTLLGVLSAQMSDNDASGLSSDLGAFWDSWDVLSKNPDGLLEKDVVLSSTQNLVASIHDAQSAIDDSRQSIGDQITDQIPRINDLLQQVASYNEHIVGFEGSQQPANDLRDSRYQVLGELSQYLGIEYTEQSNGAITVNLTDGGTTVNLVNGSRSGSLQYDSATHLVSYVDAGGTAISPASNSLSGGSLSGALYTLGRTDTYQNELDTFANALISRVNTAYGATVFDGTSAASIAVNAAFNDAASINGDAALAVADLQDQPFPELSNQTLGQYVSRLQSQIGQDELSATSRADFYKLLAGDLEAQQMSISGVSIDEETIDLLKFQQVYSAAAKIVQRTDEMLQTVINMV